ncbi:MAG: SpoIIE family protein phosphatase [Bacteroidales bacterium]|nr:SpoIIE family protein phosphatase [Bacteroidales bacterium]MBN2750447.1 SpoIIE family protein phosphatase [Bacteroidales bacterium]
MRTFTRIILIAFLLPFAFCASAQNADGIVNAQLISVNEGLSQTTITDVLIDSYGFMWVGTQDGLNRYDGYGFKSYRHQPLDSTTISSNYIYSLCEDSDRNIWVATAQGLSCFVREKGRFKTYISSIDKVNTLSSNRVFNVMQDRQGYIWAKTLESLDRLDIRTGQVIRYSHFNDYFTFPSENNSFGILEDSRGRLWVGTKDGLLYFDRALQMFKRYQFDSKNTTSLSNNQVKSLFEDSQGIIWIGTENGLNRYNPSADSFTRFYYSGLQGAVAQENVVNTIGQDINDQIWLGTDRGLCYLNLTTNKFSLFSGLYNQENKVIQTPVTSLVQDDNKIMWIGSLQGLIKWDQKSQKFRTYTTGRNGNPLFENNFVASITQSSDEVIWVGTWGAGIFRYDRKRQIATRYYTGDNRKGITNDYVHAILKTRNGQIIIGTRDGVLQYLPKEDRFVNFFSLRRVDDHGAFSKNRVYDIAEDKNGRIWFATRLGLYAVDENKLLSFYHDADNANSISSSEIYSLLIDSSGDIWIGTINGLNRLSATDFSVTRYMRGAEEASHQLLSNDVVSLAQDGKGFVWVGTSSGVHRLNKSTGSIIHLSEKDGLPNNLIYAIEPDNNAGIWVSTNWGIAKIDTTSWQVTPFGVFDGLQGYEYNIGASYQSPQGEIFFGGVSGLNSFIPDSIAVNTAIPPIVFTTLEVIGPEGKLEMPLDGKSEVVIPSGFNLFTIEFSALDFSRPEKNIYAYKLIGVQDQWVDIGGKRYATFSNLREGSYTLWVRGANGDGVWNNTGSALKIIVRTSFWDSRVAYIIYALAFALSVTLYLRARTQNLRRTRRLLHEREQVMAEVELQKEELMLKNKNITDSINYAKRIQEAIMPSLVHFKRIVPSSFVFYNPKDIVSGDFYWINEVDNKIFIAVVDCTGHGVPGAFMSIIGVELLRNIISVQGISDAAEVLNHLNKGVNDTFLKSANDDDVKVKDGMDVSFCVIDKEQKTLQFAGAFSNLYMIRHSKLVEIKGDRCSVGMGTDPETQNFTNNIIQIEPDDMLYIFTDGYVDQFGGPEGKKYKFRRFRHLLLNIHTLPVEQQRQILYESINEWRGNLEQVDDILIVGLRPDLTCGVTHRVQQGAEVNGDHTVE